MSDISEKRPAAALPRRRGAVSKAVRGVGEWTEFGVASVKGMVGSGRFVSETLRHTAILVRGTSGLMIAINLFMGFTMANVGYFVLRSIGAADYLGLISGYATPRQTGPTVFGYVFAAKVCCGFSAAIGSMRIQDEINAMESTGIDTMRYVVGTRLAASMVYAVIGYAIAMTAQILGIIFAATFILEGINVAAVLDVNWSLFPPMSIVYGVLTALAIALLCTVSACFFGYRARGGPAEVGTAVARSLFVNLALVHVIAGTMAVVFYGNDLGLPIGG